MVRKDLVTRLVNRILTNASTYTEHYTGRLVSSLATPLKILRGEWLGTRQQVGTQLPESILSSSADLLSSLVEQYHQAAMDALPVLKEAFSCLPRLPSEPALELLHAVLVSSLIHHMNSHVPTCTGKWQELFFFVCVCFFLSASH